MWPVIWRRTESEWGLHVRLHHKCWPSCCFPFVSCLFSEGSSYCPFRLKTFSPCNIFESPLSHGRSEKKVDGIEHRKKIYLQAGVMLKSNDTSHVPFSSLTSFPFIPNDFNFNFHSLSFFFLLTIPHNSYKFPSTERWFQDHHKPDHFFSCSLAFHHYCHEMMVLLFEFPFPFLIFLWFPLF